MKYTQVRDFIEREVLPSGADRKYLYTHITVTPKLLEERRKYRRANKKDPNNDWPDEYPPNETNS
jgi:hypothetical protein